MPSSPSARQSQLRSYESFIAPSPKTHAILKAPLSRLRRRTSELVDQITGATVAEDVVQEEQRLRDEARKWKCRACNVPFAGERELNKHLHMFPSHVDYMEAKRQGRHSAAVGTISPSQRRTRSSTTDGINTSSNTRLSASVPSRRPSKTLMMQYMPEPDGHSGTSDAAHAAGAARTSDHRRNLDEHKKEASTRSEQIPWKITDEDAFDTFGPFARKRSPIQSRAEAPSPALQDARSDAVRRNEQQGRDSIAKFQEQHILRKASREAHLAKREHELATSPPTTGTAAILRSARRGMSDGLLAATSTMPTKVSTSVATSPSTSPTRRFFPARTVLDSPAALSTADSDDAYFDAQSDVVGRASPVNTRTGDIAATQHDDRFADPQEEQLLSFSPSPPASSVHGETPAVQHLNPLSTTMMPTASWQSTHIPPRYPGASAAELSPFGDGGDGGNSSGSQSPASAASSSLSLASPSSPCSPITPQDHRSTPGVFAHAFALESHMHADEPTSQHKLRRKPSRRSLGLSWNASKRSLPVPVEPILASTATHIEPPKAEWIPSSRPSPTPLNPAHVVARAGGRGNETSRRSSESNSPHRSPSTSSHGHGHGAARVSPQMRPTMVLHPDAQGRRSSLSANATNVPSSPLSSKSASSPPPQAGGSAYGGATRPPMQPRKSTNPFRREDTAGAAPGSPIRTLPSPPTQHQQPSMLSQTNPWHTDPHGNAPTQTARSSPLPPAPLPTQYATAFGRRRAADLEHSHFASLNPYHSYGSGRFVPHARQASAPGPSVSSSRPAAPPETALGLWAEAYFQNLNKTGPDGQSAAGAGAKGVAA